MFHELKWIHLLGPLLATIAMFFVGDNMVRQEKGKDLRILPTIGLFAGAVLFHFLIGEGSFLDRVSIMLLDFGIGMIIDAAYLKRRNVHPKVFWGLGMTLLVGGGALMLALNFFGFMKSKLFGKDALAQNSEITALLVELGPDDSPEEIESILAKYDAKWEKAFPEVSRDENEDLSQTLLVHVTTRQSAALETELDRDDENVDEAEPDSPVALIEPSRAQTIETRGDFFANDPGLGRQWWMPAEKANAIHRFLAESKPVRKAKVAILDTGVDAGHEDVKKGFLPSPGDKDAHGHGTHCACLAGAETNNGAGIGSLNWEGKYLSIVSYPALDAKGRGTVYSVAKAITAAAENGADVISLSLGGPSRTPPKTTVNAVKYALSRNVVVIVAAGNSNEDARYHSPANVEGVITVAAVDESGHRAGFSNTNGKLSRPIAAPGVNIYSCTPGQQYDSWNGTSMATPIVAGIAGMIRSFRPGMSPDEVYQFLVTNGIEGPDASLTGKIADGRKVLEGLR